MNNFNTSRFHEKSCEWSVIAPDERLQHVVVKNPGAGQGTKTDRIRRLHLAIKDIILVLDKKNSVKGQYIDL